jgi:hypothetical protein
VFIGPRVPDGPAQVGHSQVTQARLTLKDQMSDSKVGLRAFACPGVDACLQRVSSVISNSCYAVRRIAVYSADYTTAKWLLYPRCLLALVALLLRQ